MTHPVDGELRKLPPPAEPVKKWSALAYGFAVALLILAHYGHRLVPVATRARVKKAQQPTLVVMDVSGSMSGQKIVKARQAVRNLIATFPADTVVGLRLFASRTGLLAAPSARGVAAIAANIDDIDVGGRNVMPDDQSTGGMSKRLRRLRSPLGGGTAIDRALDAAAQDIAAFGADQPWTWILVSDGQGSRPTSDIAAARRVAAAYPKVVCQTIGIEVGWSGRRELEQIAAILNGRCWVVNRDELHLAMLDALTVDSLAGFHGRSGNLGTRFIALWFTGGALLLLVVTALLLRYILSERWYTVVLGGCAGVVVWGAAQSLLPAYGSNVTVIAAIQNAAYFMIVGYGLGIVIATAEGVYLGEWRRVRILSRFAVPVGIFGGAIAGFAGQYFFVTFRGALGDSLVVGFTTRILGWALAGAIVGACPGAACGSRSRVYDGAAGGAVGGAIGGALFEALTLLIGPSGLARFIAIITIALLVAFMVQAAEAWRRYAWLVVIDGKGQGKVFGIAKTETTIGSHAVCDVCLPGSKAMPPHVAAKITRHEDGSLEISPVERYKVEVNDEKYDSHVLATGDRIRVGTAVLEFHRKGNSSEHEGTKK